MVQILLIFHPRQMEQVEFMRAWQCQSKPIVKGDNSTYRTIDANLQTMQDMNEKAFLYLERMR